MSKIAVRQDMAPAKGYPPIHWKRYAPKRTVPAYLFGVTVITTGIYAFYKCKLLLFEQRMGWVHSYSMQTQLYPFLYAEDDRRQVRARKQHEEDLKLILGTDTDWDIHRRTTKHEELFVPYASRELRILLTDDERIALGGTKSRYSINDMWSNYMRARDYQDDRHVKHLPTFDYDLEE